MATERRLPVGLLLVIPAIAGLGLYAFTAQEPVPDPSATPEASATAEGGTPTATATFDYWATVTAVVPTPPAEPTYPPEPARQSTHGAFHDGAWVRVNAGAGDCLNARNQPTMSTEWVIVNFCLPDGFEGLITGWTVEQDGHWWWYLAGAGFVAEEYLTFVREADLSVASARQFSGQGEIAFVRDADLWLMDADGGNQRRVLDLRDNENWNGPYDLTWSPDGTMLFFNDLDWTAETTVPGGGYTLNVVRFDEAGGVTNTTYDGIYAGSWSPDGTRIGAIDRVVSQQMGTGHNGIASILDIRTGERRALHPEVLSQDDPPAFNHDGTKLLVSYARWGGDVEPLPLPAAILIVDTNGNELSRIPHPDGGGIGEPHWSTTADVFAGHLYDNTGGDPRYALFDISGNVLATAAVPKASEKVGGGCGGSDMWRTDWARDGRHVLYSFAMGDTGANGIWAWDTEDGSQATVFAANASEAVSSGPNGLMAFTSWYNEPLIFIGSVDGGFATPVAEGSSPAWRP